MQRIFFLLFNLVMWLTFTGCLNVENPVTPPESIGFLSLSANGTSYFSTTTELTLIFDYEPIDLTLDHINVVGATKKRLRGSGKYRIVDVSGVTATDNNDITVEITNLGSFPVKPSSRSVAIKRMLTMVNVPTGTFQYNSIVGNNSTVSAFKMSEKEITRAQFLAIMGVDPSRSYFSSGISDPVQLVNWYHAIAFCNKLSIYEGLTEVYSVKGVNFATLRYSSIPTDSTNKDWDSATANWSANGYRLPTEMEWMWAAMGATAGNTGYLKPFAGSNGTNKVGDYVVFGVEDNPKNDGQTLTERSNPVGSKLPNELGLYDMSGNVWEWTWSWFDNNASWPNYAISGPVTDYRGADSGTKHVGHGGSWNTMLGGRYSIAGIGLDYPYKIYINYGFRVARSENND